MSLVQCFTNVLDLDTDTVSRLESMDHVVPAACDAQSLLLYCTNWCCLSDWLNRSRPKASTQPLRFVLDDKQTNSYWFNLVFYAHRLGKLTMNQVATELGLNSKTGKGAMSNCELPAATLIKLVKLCCGTIGVLHYAVTRAFQASKWVEQSLPTETDQIIEFYYVLRALTCWMTCRLEAADWCNHAKWAMTTTELIQLYQLHKYEMVQAVKNDCSIQLWLAKASCMLTTHADEGAALFCYESAATLGWLLDAKAKTMKKDCDTLQLSLPESEEEIAPHIALPETLSDPVLKGTNPLTAFTFRAHKG